MFGPQFGAYFFPDLDNLFAHFRRDLTPELAGPFLALANDFLDAVALFSTQVELARSIPDEFESALFENALHLLWRTMVQVWGGLPWGRGVDGRCGFRPWLADASVVNQEATSDNPGAENHNGGEDDFPDVHRE